MSGLTRHRFGVPIVSIAVSLLIASASMTGMTQAQTAPTSLPVERDGLQVTIQPSKPQFTSGEKLVLKVTYLNVTKDPIRLWNAVEPAPYGLWTLFAEDVNTGKRYTGASLLPGGAAPDATRVHPATLRPGEPQSTIVTFQNFGFVEGALSNSETKTALFNLNAARTKGAENQLPIGTYKLSVEIRRFRFADSPSTSSVISSAQSQYDRTLAGNDVIPIWKDSEVISNPVKLIIGN
jgi:hypothetical protein